MNPNRAQDKQASAQAAAERALWKIIKDASANLPAGPDRPAEVAELLSGLHQAAEQRYQDLRPKGVSLWVIAALALVFIGLLATGLVSYKIFVADPTATAVALANAETVSALQTSIAVSQTEAARIQTVTAVAQATAAAETSTAEFLAGDATAQTATARAAEESAMAGTVAALTQAAQDTAATQTAAAQGTLVEVSRCDDVDELSLEAGEFTVQPEHGYIYVEGDPKPNVEISWPVTNTSPTCAWNSIRLIHLATGAPVAANVYVNNRLTFPAQEPIPAGVTMTIRVAYPIAETALDEWVLEINGQQKLQWRLKVNVKNWVTTVNPTPLPTPTPTVTPDAPTPSPKPPDPGDPPGDR